MTARRFNQLRIWQQARHLAGRTYQSVGQSREFWLRDQAMRAVLSVMNNIAEGFARGSDADFSRFLDYARASAVEAQSTFALALDIGVIGADVQAELERDCDQIAAGIARLQEYLAKGRVGEAPEVYSP